MKERRNGLSRSAFLDLVARGDAPLVQIHSYGQPQGSGAQTLQSSLQGSQQRLEQPTTVPRIMVHASTTIAMRFMERSSQSTPRNGVLCFVTEAL